MAARTEAGGWRSRFERPDASGWRPSGRGCVGGPASEHMEPIDHVRPRDPGVRDPPGDYVDRQTFLVQQAGQIPRLDTPQDVVEDGAFADVGRLRTEDPPAVASPGSASVWKHALALDSQKLGEMGAQRAART